MGTREPGELPPVTVSCTASECGHQFLSRAERHAVVRCPRCKRPVRVKRPRPPGWRRKPAARAPRAAPAPERVCQESAPKAATVTGPAVAVLPRASSAAGTTEDQADDDGWAYIIDGAGKPVLADLTPDGHMIPVQLVDQRFRAIAPGFCSVYGCTNPARHLARGWPVCPQCRRDLAESPG